MQAFIDRTLYIKYLEDNHIINSAFYKHYFGDENVKYETLLSDHKTNQINNLFTTIHKIFNNSLFDKPSIEKKYFTANVFTIIFNSLTANLVTGQLRLFDFQFDVIPVEFISYIYEIFLSEKQKTNGIYYTPKKLAQLIIDEVIPNETTGRVLDPSCGSGMFLIIAFQRLLENSREFDFEDIEKRIQHRTKVLSENIFGIEKQVTAQRFTIFSLSLQLFRDLNKTKLKDYIAKQLKEKGEVDIFKGLDLSNNIICANTLNIDKIPFENETFDYIVGNPPFFEIKNTTEFTYEHSFLNNYELHQNNSDIKAKDIVSYSQISQCFLLKIKDWSNTTSRFGFVSNSSNFYDTKSGKFQSHIYKNYNIEKIYEFSKVKDILFENAKESVISLIFTNQLRLENEINYYPIELGVFSEKPFELLVIREDKMITLAQKKLINREIRLRDYLVGNQFDLNFIHSINKRCITADNFIEKRKNDKLFIHTGLQIAGVDSVIKEFSITREQYNLNKKHYLHEYKKKYTRANQTKEYATPLLAARNIKNFVVESANCFVKDIKNFRRKGYAEDIYSGERILWSRIGRKLSAVLVNKRAYFEFDVHVIKLNNPKLYYLFTALLNSDLVNYYTNLVLRKRMFDFHSKIDISDFCNIPIPKQLDEELVTKISDISRQLTEHEEYTEAVAQNLNDLIFDLYDLSFIEKQRIKDYYLEKKKISNSGNEIEKYKIAFSNTVRMYLKNPIHFEYQKIDFGLLVMKVMLNKKESDSPNAYKVGKYLLHEIFQLNPSENFLAAQEKIYSEDCVYIIKKGLNTNWTETKAHEDGQDILNHIIN